MKNLNLIVAIFLLNFVNLSAQRTFTNQNTTATNSLAQSLQINGYQRIPSNLRVIVVELQLF
jgi:ribosomal protein L31E